jgi:Flp pilus assembly protein TadD
MLVVFWHTTGFGFLLDDVVLFQKSASLSDLGSIARGFVTDVGALRKGSAVVLGSFYRPVFLALSTLYYQVVGGATFGWHLAAVVMAATVAALAARVFLRLGFRPLPSLLGAAVFSFHPAHVSSVAWAAGLQEQLVALFVLLAVSALLGRRAEERPRAAVGLATVAFVAALLSKEVAIALLPMAAAWAWLWRREDPPVARRFARAAAVFTGVAVVYLVVRVVVLGGLAKPWPRAPGLAEAIPSVPLAFVTYLKMLVWPVGFSFFRPERAVWGLLDAPVLVSIGIVALLGVGLVVTARRMPGLLLPAAWFVVWLLPVLNFWALRPEWMVTDRYLFLPSLALPWALLVVLPRRAAAPVLAAVAVVFAVLAVRYAAIFADERTFYAAMARAEPTSSFLAAEQARLLLNDGHRTAAEAALRRAVELAPREPDNLRAIGDLELGRGDFAAAEGHYRRALAEEPAASKPFKQLALALARAGERERAAALVEESAGRWPADFEVQLMHAVFLATGGQRSRAEAAFAAASRLRPGDPALAGGLDATLARLAPMLLPGDPAR